jgi:hypothetical protein
MGRADGFAAHEGYGVSGSLEIRVTTTELRRAAKQFELPGCRRQRPHQCGKPLSSLTLKEMQVACRMDKSGKVSNIN